MHRAIVLVATLVLACGNERPGNTVDAGVAVVPEAGSAAPEALGDGEIAGVLHAINAGEIREAELVAASATRPNVASFASQIVTDHTSADTALTRAATSASIVPTESVLGAQLEQSAARDLASLKTQIGSTLDESWVALQVADHRAALAMLDRILARWVKSPALAAQVQAARALVTDHLSHAQALEDALSR